MTERNLPLAVLNLFAGCFGITVGFFAVQNARASLVFLGLALLVLGTQMLVMGTLNALPGRMRRARTVPRALGILLALAVVSLAIAGIVAEFRQ